MDDQAKRYNDEFDDVMRETRDRASRIEAEELIKGSPGLRAAYRDARERLRQSGRHLSAENLLADHDLVRSVDIAMAASGMLNGDEDENWAVAIELMWRDHCRRTGQTVAIGDYIDQLLREATEDGPTQP